MVRRLTRSQETQSLDVFAIRCLRAIRDTRADMLQNIQIKDDIFNLEYITDVTRPRIFHRTAEERREAHRRGGVTRLEVVLGSRCCQHSSMP